MMPNVFCRAPRNFSRELAELFENRHRGAFPRLTLEETAEAFVVRAVLPGCDPATLAVAASGDMLTLRGKRVVECGEGERFLGRERSAGALDESFKLPGRVAAERAAAAYVNGVLTVTLPREAVPAGTVIPVVSE